MKHTTLLVVALLAGCNVVTAPERVVNRTLETDNIIMSYEWFFDANAQYEARIGQLAQYKTLLTDTGSDGERNRMRMEQAAIAQSCRELVTKYNANSIKLNKEFFKSKKLPVELSLSSCDN